MIKAGNRPAARQADSCHPILQHFCLWGVQRWNGHIGARLLWPRGNTAKPFLNQRLCRLHINITRQNEHRIVGAIMLAEPSPDIIHRGCIQIGHRSDDRMTIRMPGWHRALDLRIGDKAIGLVIPLTLFILDNADLVGELFGRHCAQKIAHPVAFQEQHAVQRACRHGLVIIGPVERGGAVKICCAQGLQRLEIIAIGIFRTIEHQMFKQMGKARLALRLMLGPDIIPDGHRNHRGFAVCMHKDAQAIAQHKALMRNIHLFDERFNRSRPCGRTGRNRRNSQCGCNQSKRDKAHREPQISETTASFYPQRAGGQLPNGQPLDWGLPAAPSSRAISALCMAHRIGPFEVHRLKLLLRIKRHLIGIMGGIWSVCCRSIRLNGL